jgi:hypothetical protein
VGPRLVLTGPEILASTTIRSPDHPARIESLWRLCYPGHLTGHIGFSKYRINMLCFRNSTPRVLYFETVRGRPGVSNCKYFNCDY